jgi:hypothetical protein
MSAEQIGVKDFATNCFITVSRGVESVIARAKQFFPPAETLLYVCLLSGLTFNTSSVHTFDN